MINRVFHKKIKKAEERAESKNKITTIIPVIDTPLLVIFTPKSHSKWRIPLKKW
ncbi:MAG: hypothetical protein U0X86_001322 [Wolbachia endosymbiont of Xenopsylla cheopis]